MKRHVTVVGLLILKMKTNELIQSEHEVSKFSLVVFLLVITIKHLIDYEESGLCTIVANNKVKFPCKGKSQKSLLSVESGAQRRQSQWSPIFYESIKAKLIVSVPGLRHTSKCFHHVEPLSESGIFLPAEPFCQRWLQ